MNDTIDSITAGLSESIKEIATHPVYACLSDMNNLRFFMEQHVFAVWDFMCLLKELHSRIVSTKAPWFPPRDSLSANLISSILVEEEGDRTENGMDYLSHYEIYLSAMASIGAKTGVIDEFLLKLQQGESVNHALEDLPILSSTKSFVLETFSFFQLPVHQLAAAFVYGREGITSAMFSNVIHQLILSIDQKEQHSLSTLIYYLKRHVELDSHEHFPKALEMLRRLVGHDVKKHQEVLHTAKKALQARMHFFSGIYEALTPKSF